MKADLVSLSACETALGKVATGDDVVGFTRGFLYAGARSLLSSLWQVDDKATHDLMVAFYSNLSKMDKDEALRQAQIKTKRQEILSNVVYGNNCRRILTFRYLMPLLLPAFPR